jgi:Fic family protein
MNKLIPIIVGVIALALGYWLGKRHSPKMANGQVGTVDKTRDKNGLIAKQALEKRKNLEAILGLMESGNQPLTNDHVEQMLSISNSTAERYLQELETEGKIRQVGNTGRNVYYEKI